MAYVSSIAKDATGPGAATDLARLLGPVAGILSGIAAIATLSALFGANSAS